MYLTPDTPPGCADAVDLDSGTWWRLRALLQSDLIAEGISPMVQAVSLRDSNLPPSPEDQHRNALLSERLLAASVAAASSIPTPLWSAWRTLRAELDAVSRSVAALQAQADKGVDVGPALVEARARAEALRPELEAARAAAVDPAARGPWKTLKVTLDPGITGDGVVHYADLPGSALGVIAQAMNGRREATAERLRSFLGG